VTFSWGYLFSQVVLNLVFWVPWEPLKKKNTEEKNLELSVV
jgi:hypothetical protein